MGYRRIKTEHGGAKNGGGAWMTRAEAKETAKRRRRQAGRNRCAARWAVTSQAPPVAAKPANSTARGPWADPDPQPGDFDSELDQARPDQIEIHEGHPLSAAHARLRQTAERERVAGDWDDLEHSSAPAPRGVLRHMTEDEEEAGLSWEELRPQ
jgi:hypothetical protein